MIRAPKIRAFQLQRSLQCRDSVKCLGVILDLRITWLQHVRYVADRALCAVGLLRALSRVSWGVSPSLLLQVYRDLVRAYLEWGAPLILTASRSTLSILDRVQNEALRADLGCMRSTPVSILLSKANEPALGLRRSMLRSHFILRNVSWRGSALIPKLRMLSERVRRRVCRLNPMRFSLIFLSGSYAGVWQAGRSQVPGFSYPVLWWGSWPCSWEGGAGFCVPSIGYRFGVRLSNFNSVLLAELYAICLSFAGPLRYDLHRFSILLIPSEGQAVIHSYVSFRLQNFTPRLAHPGALWVSRVRLGAAACGYREKRAGWLRF